MARLPLILVTALIYALSSGSPLILSVAYAGLGEDSTSVDNDFKHFSKGRQDSHKVDTSHPLYEIHVIRVDSVIVREYVSVKSGIRGPVFAVAWRGKVHPDLSQILSAYAQDKDFQTAIIPKRRTRGRRVQTVNTGSLVFERGGQMRNLYGFAYDPGLMPAGVTVDDLKFREKDKDEAK